MFGIPSSGSSIFAKSGKLSSCNGAASDSIDLGSLSLEHNIFPRVRCFTSDRLRVMISADRNFSASHSNSGDSCKVKLRPPTGLCYHWANPQMPNADPTYQPWLLALWEACVLMTRILKIPHEVRNLHVSNHD